MPPSISTPVRWQTPRGAELQWRAWREQAAVFNPYSGDTHLLDAVAAAGLRCLETSALDETALAEQLAELLDVDCDHRLRAYAAELLSRFAFLGLIERL